MDQKKIISRFEHTLELIDVFKLKNEPAVLRKGELFIDYGEKNNKIGILMDGLLYASYLSDNGTEWVSRFFFPPNNFIVSSHRGFVLGKNSSESIRAYEDSKLIYIEKDEFKNLLDTNHKFERTVRILAEESYIQAMDRIHSFQSLNAEQRIRKFLEEHQDLAQKLQRQHIASYLGIHRNILTRILYKL
ncbi:Crp/Fnr family transcriptional regulator [uncultured Draconibacterium sp.]|uniref:Crp/Fnr family transcriptional regulator n=1 Tax=uncultured Draconibacterium sp. TaxID=1573823 RepID=UPI003216D3E2